MRVLAPHLVICFANDRPNPPEAPVSNTVCPRKRSTASLQHSCVVEDSDILGSDDDRRNGLKSVEVEKGNNESAMILVLCNANGRAVIDTGKGDHASAVDVVKPTRYATTKKRTAVGVG
mmetsp:Transcript_24475/g.34522  ORF Transcript_24475/g.34522 Transcript_24475/m.34522 type:complete len:119 (-) Transcript_24475:110-466(-)